MKAVRLFMLPAALLAAGAAQALDYRSVGAAPAVLYDAPSLKGRKLFVAPRGMPLEVVLTYGEWMKVRDMAGDLTWVQSRLLVPRRNVVVNAASARVRAAAEESAPIVFTADKGVLLDMLDPVTAGWVRVRHRDGQSGFVRATEVWGE
ncbi:MAG TPA: SH3 domain-containing protein [Noviherbaspirillum sp.]|uniref:SH3 domain-containing protein n=1 Tax=Noviherbaspirillum sp. TaxID=1926288 RepID=UPI002D60CA85|nr:SH3 domain-containing protein [Noviherbaspirillum sp.]HYD96434.1 SH3 domain-containing protein [Noviherbaspirillum sp.]